MPINMERDPTTMIRIALETHIKHVAPRRIGIAAVWTLALISIPEDPLVNTQSQKKKSVPENPPFLDPSTYSITDIAAHIVARSLTDRHLESLIWWRFRQQFKIVLHRDPMVDSNLPGCPASPGLSRWVGVAVVDEIIDNVEIGLATGPVQRRPAVHVLSLN